MIYLIHIGSIYLILLYQYFNTSDSAGVFECLYVFFFFIIILLPNYVDHNFYH